MVYINTAISIITLDFSGLICQLKEEINREGQE